MKHVWLNLDRREWDQKVGRDVCLAPSSNPLTLCRAENPSSGQITAENLSLRSRPLPNHTDGPVISDHHLACDAKAPEPTVGLNHFSFIHLLKPGRGCDPRPFDLQPLRQPRDVYFLNCTATFYCFRVSINVLNCCWTSFSFAVDFDGFNGFMWRTLITLLVNCDKQINLFSPTDLHVVPRRATCYGVRFKPVKDIKHNRRTHAGVCVFAFGSNKVNK